MATEIEHLRRLTWSSPSTTGRTVYRGRRTYAAAEASALSESVGFKGQTFPGIGGANAPLCLGADVIFRPNHVKGAALILLDYRSPSLSVFRRETGKARIVSRTQSHYEKLLKAPFSVEGATSLVIEGDDPNNNRERWVVVEGDNRVPEFQTVFEIQTATTLAGFNLEDFLAIEGTTNANDITVNGFGTMAAGKFVALALSVSAEFDEDIIGLNYLVGKAPRGQLWNETLKSQKQALVAVEVPVVDEDGVPTGEDRQVRRWRFTDWAGNATSPEPRAKFTEADWDLDGLTRW